MTVAETATAYATVLMCRLARNHWLKLPSAERRQRDSLKSCERFVEVCQVRLDTSKERIAIFGQELPPANF